MGTNNTKHPLPQLTPTPVSEISVIPLSQDPGRYTGHDSLDNHLDMYLGA